MNYLFNLMKPFEETLEPKSKADPVRNIEKACDAANQLHVKKSKVVKIPSLKDLLENPPF